MADAFTSTSTSSFSGGNNQAPVPTPPATGALRCPGDGTEGQLRPEGFWQCPTCGVRLDGNPAEGQQGAISLTNPQPIKQQELQLIPAAQQPHAHLIASMIPSLDLTAPAATGPASTAAGGFTEPDPASDTPTGGRADDPSLGSAGAPYVAPEPPAPVVSYPPMEPEPLEAPGRIDPVPFTEPEGPIQ